MSMVMKRWMSGLFAAAAVGAASAGAGNAMAQAYPSRPVTVVFPFSAGSPVDTAFRDVGVELSKVLGQPVVLESRPGANNRLGISGIKAAAPDGYLLTMAFDAILVSQPILDPTFAIEPGKDYAPIGFFMEFPFVMVAANALPANDVAGIIAYAKANPGKVNFSGVGGGSGYIMLERIRQVAGLNVAMVPYKGSPQAMVDLVAGRVDLLLTTAAAKPFIQSGKIKGIATTGAQRWTSFPELKTLTESGLPVSGTSWYGLVAHVSTPPEIIARLNAAMNTVLKNPETRRKLDENFGMVTGRMSTPEEFGNFIRAETRVWTPVLKASGIKME